MGFSKRPVLRLEFGEEPHVLDGDDGLVREGLEQIDLRVGKEDGCPARDRDDADGTALVDHGHGENRSQPDPTILLARGQVQVFGLNIRHMDDCRIDKGARYNRAPPARHLGEESRGEISRARPWIVLRSQMKALAVVARDDGILAVAEPAGTPYDGVEDRLNVGGRARDDPQDLRGGCLLLQSLAQRTLQGRIRRRWLGTASKPQEGRAALLAELRSGAILVLAPGTRHAGPPSGRAAEGRNRRPRLTARDS